MRPRVILHNAVSLDGKVNGFMPDVARFYQLARVWAEDATLAGSETILAAAAGEGAPDETAVAGSGEAAAAMEAGVGDGGEATPAPADDPRAGQAAAAADEPGGEPANGGGLLVVPDSRGRVRCWRWLLSQPFWSRGVALCSKATPQEHLDYLRAAGIGIIQAGEQQVDLKAALEELAEGYAVRTVRADSGGALNTALLEGRLVDEVSLLVHPCLAGAAQPSFYRADGQAAAAAFLELRLVGLERLEGGLAWLRYEVMH